MSAADLWTAVKGSYDTPSLRELTNVRDTSATAPDDAVGTDAAQGVINLWPIYAQVDYDPLDATHVEVAKRGVIAMLWERGGSASQIAKLEWDEVFTDGVIERLKRTGPRGHESPQSNSGVDRGSELLSDGSKAYPWSDPNALPSFGILPSRSGSNRE